MNQKRTAPFAFALKSISKNGQFTGRASVYGVVDAHNDVVMRGAFRNTLQDLGGRIKVLNQHNPDDPIGTAELIDRADGLHAEGQLVLDLPSARDAHTRLVNGLIDGISIGYEVIDEAFVGNVRQLKEIKLWEISLVTFPANALARVTDVKNRNHQALSASLRSYVQTIRSTTAALKGKAMKSLFKALRGMESTAVSFDQKRDALERQRDRLQDDVILGRRHPEELQQLDFQIAALEREQATKETAAASASEREAKREKELPAALDRLKADLIDFEAKDLPRFVARVRDLEAQAKFISTSYGAETAGHVTGVPEWLSLVQGQLSFAAVFSERGNSPLTLWRGLFARFGLKRVLSRAA